MKTFASLALVIRTSAILALALLLLAVVQAQAQAVSDEVIEQHIQMRVSQVLGVDTATVRINVGEGFVVLSGEVRLYSQKLSIERIVWQTTGVEFVDNEIRVAPQLPLDDESIEKEIRRILRSHRRFLASNAKIRVESGAVFINATFLHPRDDIFLKQKVAGIEGVIAIEIEPIFIARSRSNLSVVS